MRDMGPPPVSGGAQGQKQIPFGDDNQMNNGNQKNNAKNNEQRQEQRRIQGLPAARRTVSRSSLRSR
jgi:hypothetical protein